MQINAKIRQEFGKKNKTLRKNNNIPGVVMEKGQASVPILMNLVQFSKVYGESGETSLIDFSADDKKYKVLISDVQLNPITMKPIHAVFRKVDLKEKLTAEIPVSIINEELNPLVKAGDAIVLKLLDDIAVEALPSDLPKEFVIDASKLANIGDQVTVSDLDYDRAKVEITEYEPSEAVARLDKMEEIQAEEEGTAVSEEEALAQVTATEELSPEEKAKRDEEKKQEKAQE